MKNGRYIIREFEPERDIDGVYKAFKDGFYHNSWPLIDQAEPRFIRDMLLEYAAFADCSIVAESEGEARGILMGCFSRKGIQSLEAFSVEIHFMTHVLLRRYAMTPFARAAFWRQMQGNFSYMLRAPRSKAEILLLSSQEGYRGGIGRAMMDGWVDEVRRRGYSETIVSTESTVSYGFYESCGFKRIREFPLKIYFHSLPGEDVTGYIYRYEIPPLSCR